MGEVAPRINSSRIDGNESRSFRTAAGDLRCYHEAELVDDVCGKQCLGHRDTGVDSDVAAGLDLQVLDEFDQIAVDRSRICPFQLEWCGCRTYFVTPLMNVANGWISLSGQNSAHSL